MDKRMVQVAVAGVGGWGKNLARNYFQIPRTSAISMSGSSTRYGGSCRGPEPPPGSRTSWRTGTSTPS